MAVGLSGNLVDFGIADVFQLIGQQRKTGVLELRKDDARVQLVFDRGLVVSAAPADGRSGDPDPVADRLVRCGLLTRARASEAAAICRASAQTFSRTLVDRGWLDSRAVREAEELVTRDTIFDVLRWESGRFDFRAQDVSHERSPADLLGAEQILMDGLRMVDEWQSFREWVPSEETVFARLGSSEDFVADRPGLAPEERARAERVLALVDGRLGARRVIDLARLGTFDGVRCLADLCRGGAIEIAGDGAPAAGAVAPRYARSGRGGRVARGALAALAPLAVLSLVVWWTAAGWAAPTDSAIRIERSTRASLARDYGMRSVRQALAAYRLGYGEWPERLEQLEETGLLPSGALAALGGRPYYSSHRERGPFLLAPDGELESVPSRGSP